MHNGTPLALTNSSSKQFADPCQGAGEYGVYLGCSITGDVDDCSGFTPQQVVDDLFAQPIS